MNRQYPREYSRFFRVISSKPPVWYGWALSATLFGMVVLFNLVVFQGRQIGIAYSLPLIACLWTRDRVLLYLMAAAGSALAIIKIGFFLSAQVIGTEQWLAIFFQLLNIWIPAFAIRMANFGFDRLEQKRNQLNDTNKELVDTNHELSVREQEVLHQNKELQIQSEELERQAEELRQQAEELEQQTVELHAANDELTRRERGLQTLLESARWLRSDLSEKDVMSAVCQAAVQVMEVGVTAAAVIHSVDGTLSLRGHFGFGVHGTLRHQVAYAESFARLVIERGQTAYVPDLESRPDIVAVQPAAGRPFRSLLATPLSIEGRIIGVVEVYAQQPREWTDGEFKVIEWLAAQCALALQAIEYQQEVVVKRREAEEASVQKTRFLAAISHDVRTPANAISLMADLIEQAADGFAQAHDASGTAKASSEGLPGATELPALARDLKANARSLVELVSDVLDLTRLDTGKLDLQVSDFSLARLLQNEVRQFERIAAEKHLRMTLHAQPADVHLKTDRMKLARIISNLLGNAVKFTEAGAVDLRTNLLADGSLTIIVADTGVGIPKDSLPRIFDEFYQLQNPERDRNKGAGLGLAICRRLVEALGCTLSVESAVGLGTTFTIALPATLVTIAAPIAANQSANAHSPKHRDRRLERAKILLVEDHDVTRRATARLLTGVGATVLEARGGREALHLLVHDQPTVLLLDLMLPDADGTDILKHLKTHRPASLRCVLAVSGDVRDARVAEVKELGADDLLAKPLNIESLLEAIITHLGG